MDKENKYQILKTWDDLKADWSYTLYIDSGQGQGWQKTIYNGDGDWATREQQHYKAEIVDSDGNVVVNTPPETPPTD